MFYDLKDIVHLTGVVVKPRTLAEGPRIKPQLDCRLLWHHVSKSYFPVSTAHEGLISSLK